MSGSEPQRDVQQPAEKATAPPGLVFEPDVRQTVLVTSRGRRTRIEEIDGVRVVKAGRLATVS